MKKNVAVACILWITVAIFSTTGFAQTTLASLNTEVRAKILPISEVMVIEPLAVGFAYPWTSSEGQALVAYGVGQLLVESNSSWFLNVDVVENFGFKVSVRPAGDPRALWMDANGLATIEGEHGRFSDLRWDVKIEEVGTQTYEHRQNLLQFVFTIGSR